MPPITPLSRERVKEAVPFSHSGIDYFGPKGVDLSFHLLSYKSCSLRAYARNVDRTAFTRTQKICSKTWRSSRNISNNAVQCKLAADTIDKLWGQILTEPDVISYSVIERI